MIAPNSIDLKTLPALPLSRRKELPQTAGIYFAIDAGGVVQYIGQSINLRQRWLQHHRQTALTFVHDVRIAWIEVNELSLLKEIEGKMIRHFKPLLNGLKMKPDTDSPDILIPQLAVVKTDHSLLTEEEVKAAKLPDFFGKEGYFCTEDEGDDYWTNYPDQEWVERDRGFAWNEFTFEWELGRSILPQIEKAMIRLKEKEQAEEEAALKWDEARINLSKAQEELMELKQLMQKALDEFWAKR